MKIVLLLIFLIILPEFANADPWGADNELKSLVLNILFLLITIVLFIVVVFVNKSYRYFNLIFIAFVVCFLLHLYYLIKDDREFFCITKYKFSLSNYYKCYIKYFFANNNRPKILALHILFSITIAWTILYNIIRNRRSPAKFGR